MTISSKFALDSSTFDQVATKLYSKEYTGSLQFRDARMSLEKESVPFRFYLFFIDELAIETSRLT